MRRITLTFGGLLLALSVFAQESDDVLDISPSVDTSTYEASASGAQSQSGLDEVATADEEPGEQDAIEPSVDVSNRQFASNGDVMDRMTLGRTEITGNQELPKVMYIVPWKKSDPGDLMGRPVNTLLDEVLAPVNREEFIRQVGFYDDLYASDENLSSP